MWPEATILDIAPLGQAKTVPLKTKTSPALIVDVCVDH